MTIQIAILDDNVDIFNAVGFIPSFLDNDDPRPAREQFHEGYAHGGGWRSMKGFTRDGMTLTYPGDPPFMPIAAIPFRNETVLIYRHGIVAIIQQDGSFEVSRLD